MKLIKDTFSQAFDDTVIRTMIQKVKYERVYCYRRWRDRGKFLEMEDKRHLDLFDRLANSKEVIVHQDAVDLVMPMIAFYGFKCKVKVK